VFEVSSFSASKVIEGILYSTVTESSIRRMIYVLHKQIIFINLIVEEP
jgi:hypothetical protein